MRSWIWIGMVACTPASVKGTPDTDVAAPDDTATPAPPETDVPVDSGPPDDTAPTDTAPVDTSPPEPEGLVRFIAMGDGGEGNPDQYAVAAAVKTVCEARGCDFALYLGDNFYDDGVHSEDDSQFQTKFEQPYADLDFPFHVVLGNHDFGEIPVQFWRTDYQIAYTNVSDKWSMPDHFYAFEQDHAKFIGLDTNMIMLGLNWTGNQKPWVRDQIANSSAHWKIAFGHHPWKSNGRHGNAGNYEGVGFLGSAGSVVNGLNIQSFFRDQFCNKIDLYLCGHDHNRQWLDPTCGVNLIVAGAAAKTTDFENRDKNGTVWDDDQIEGFTWIELDGRTATIAFYDKDGTLQHEGTITK